MKLTRNYIEFNYKGYNVGYILPWRRLVKTDKYIIFFNDIPNVFDSKESMSDFIESYNLQLEYDKEWLKEVKQNVRIRQYFLSDKERSDKDVNEEHTNFISNIDITNLSC
jgi:hypothetical protein